jgi:hypothetical protein
MLEPICHREMLGEAKRKLFMILVKQEKYRRSPPSPVKLTRRKPPLAHLLC